MPTLRSELRALNRGDARRLFDLGCSNGSVAAALAQDGWHVTGVDPSREGIAVANDAHPELPFR
jgi:2-polyprenyl-6-hydroxyphenyl methylase/3-demethylubiquinone-9 3-methyltransferase